MSAFTGQHDAFREELKTKYKHDINILTSTIKGMTESDAVDLLIRSIERVKDGAEPKDSPVWKVAKFIHDGGANNVKDKRGLAAKIAQKTGVNINSTRGALNKYDFNLPAHLKPKRDYPQRTVTDIPKVSAQQPKPEAPQVYEIGEGGVNEIVVKAGNVEITLKMK